MHSWCVSERKRACNDYWNGVLKAGRPESRHRGLLGTEKPPQWLFMSYTVYDTIQIDKPLMNNSFPETNPPASACGVLIVGAGQAGARVAQHLREGAYEGRIVLVGDEPHPPYERPPLSKEYLAGERDAASLLLQAEDYWRKQRIELRLKVRLQALDRHARVALLDDGSRIRYEKLVVATGGRPRPLAAPAAGAAGMLAVRTLEDARQLRERLADVRRLAIVGGGVIGLEVASTARKAGMEVQVFEAGPYLMGRVLCPSASGWLAQLHRDAGVVLHLGARLERVEGTPGGMALQARLMDGARVRWEADLAVVAIGVDVAQPFLAEAGLGDEDGMPVDEYCRSPVDAHCYAAGDVARTANAYLGGMRRQETWRNAENQAKAVAEFILGRTEPYAELPWMWTDQHGRNIQVVGVPRDITETVLRGVPGENPFCLFWLRGNVLRGGVLVDSGRERRFLERLVQEARPVSAQSLADPAVPLKSLL